MFPFLKIWSSSYVTNMCYAHTWAQYLNALCSGYICDQSFHVWVDYPELRYLTEINGSFLLLSRDWMRRSMLTYNQTGDRITELRESFHYFIQVWTIWQTLQTLAQQSPLFWDLHLTWLSFSPFLPDSCLILYETNSPSSMWFLCLARA